MDKNVLVGVVMPYHAGMGQFLAAAIGGVAVQEVPLVLYLVGNNPDRRTQKMAEEVVAKSYLNPNFNCEFLFVDDQQGVAYARNAALEAISKRADITHIAFCDCDDVWDFYHLSTHIKEHENAGVDMIYSDVQVEDEHGNALEVFGIPYYQEFHRGNLLQQNFIFISSVVLSAKGRGCWPAGGFDHSADPMGDWDYWIRVSEKSVVKHIQKQTLTYMWKTSGGSYYQTEDMARAAEYVKKKHAPVEGWLSASEGDLLELLAAGKKCLEVGSYKGRSTTRIAKSAFEVTCVDTFACAPDGQTQVGSSILPEFMNNVSKYVDKINVVVGDSREVHSKLCDGEFDLIFLDAMHDYSSVYLDITNFLPKLKHDGVIVLHDYNNNDYPGVKRAANEILGLPTREVDSIAVYDRSTVISIGPPVITAYTAENFDRDIIYSEHVAENLPWKSDKSAYKKYLDEKYGTPIVVIAPFARKLPDGKKSPKDMPLDRWIVLTDMLRDAGIHTIQIGSAGEDIIGADEMMFNLTNESLRTLVVRMTTYVTVDTFFQHFATYYGKKGVVIFSQSNPEIFGHFSNVNLLKSKEFLRDNQFWLWTQTEYAQDAFVSVDQIFEEVMKLVNEKNI